MSLTLLASLDQNPEPNGRNHTEDSGVEGHGRAGTGKLEVAGQGDRASHQGFHHIGLVVPKRFGSKENVHQVVAADHLQDCGTGAEGATAAAPVSK